LGVSGQVHFLGQLDVAGLQAELSRAACLALTSHRENAPLVISEAQAAGVPVVASRVCGIPYMVEDGVTGRLVNPADPDDIARGIDQLLHGDDPIAAGKAARSRAERTCRASSVASRTVGVYEEVLRAA
jgi:glycosyltransferase involved in cell wall biosynthesis